MVNKRPRTHAIQRETAVSPAFARRETRDLTTPHRAVASPEERAVGEDGFESTAPTTCTESEIEER
jgi:hypothetical protein